MIIYICQYVTNYFVVYILIPYSFTINFYVSLRCNNIYTIQPVLLQTVFYIPFSFQGKTRRFISFFGYLEYVSPS